MPGENGQPGVCKLPSRYISAPPPRPPPRSRWVELEGRGCPCFPVVSQRPSGGVEWGWLGSGGGGVETKRVRHPRHRSHHRVATACTCTPPDPLTTSTHTLHRPTTYDSRVTRLQIKKTIPNSHKKQRNKHTHKHNTHMPSLTRKPARVSCAVQKTPKDKTF